MVREPQDLRLGERDLLEEMSMNEEVEDGEVKPLGRVESMDETPGEVAKLRCRHGARGAAVVASAWRGSNTGEAGEQRWWGAQDRASGAGDPPGPSSPCSKTCRLITPESIIATISHRSTMNGIELSSEDKAILVETLKNKLQALAEQHVDVLESLAPSVRKRVDVLMEIQSQHDELEVKFFEEKAALEAKYQKLYGPLYSKEKGVPDFWLNAMKNNEILAEEIHESDEEALKYLKDIKWCRIDDPKGFKFEFFFYTNPFFKNQVLTKTYHMIDEDDEPILEKAIGTEIEWHPGYCLTQEVLTKESSESTKPITKTEECESFFNFFSPPQVPDDDAKIDENTAEELQNQMERDYDIAEAVQDEDYGASWVDDEEEDDNNDEYSDEEA
nr:putative nucleosome assembly protein 1 [Oryza sativa Japonica Group]BAD35508.1 putative nucleosome assembly protein 1 [Oryza sativa Japonica Group]